jgi:hypothetical protein
MHRPILILCAIFSPIGIRAQSPLVEPCPQCARAAQTHGPDPLASAEVIYIHNPQPVQFPAVPGARLIKLTSDLQARVVNTRPLVFDILDNSGSKQEIVSNACGLFSIAIADDKLQGALSALRFDERVNMTVLYGGNSDYPHESVLTALSPANSPGAGSGNCANHSGIVLSYRGLVEYVDVHGDGAISYHDPMFQVFDHQKLSSGELEQLMDSFAAAGFDTFPPLQPAIGQPFQRDSLILICSRVQGARSADIAGPRFAALRASLSQREMSDGLSPALSTRNSRPSSPQLKQTSNSRLVRIREQRRKGTRRTPRPE